MPLMVSAVLAVALNLILLVSVHEGIEFKELQIFDDHFKECMKNPPEQLAKEDLSKLHKNIFCKVRFEDKRSDLFKPMLMQELKCFNSIFMNHDGKADVTKLLLYIDFLTLCCTLRAESYILINYKKDSTQSYSEDREALAQDFALLYGILYVFMNSIPYEPIFECAAEMYKEILRRKETNLTEEAIKDLISYKWVGFMQLRRPSQIDRARITFARDWDLTFSFVQSVLPKETKLPTFLPRERPTSEYEEMMERVRKTGFPDVQMLTEGPGSSIVKIIRAILNDNNDQEIVGTSHDMEAPESNTEKLAISE